MGNNGKRALADPSRLRPLDPSLRLVALTGHSGPGDVLAALEAGFDHYLVKPCDPGKLQLLLDSYTEADQPQTV